MMENGKADVVHALTGEARVRRQANQAWMMKRHPYDMETEHK